MLGAGTGPFCSPPASASFQVGAALMSNTANVINVTRSRRLCGGDTRPAAPPSRLRTPAGPAPASRRSGREAPALGRAPRGDPGNRGRAGGPGSGTQNGSWPSRHTEPPRPTWGPSGKPHPLTNEKEPSRRLLQRYWLSRCGLPRRGGRCQSKPRGAGALTNAAAVQPPLANPARAGGLMSSERLFLQLKQSVSAAAEAAVREKVSRG